MHLEILQGAFVSFEAFRMKHERYDRGTMMITNSWTNPINPKLERFWEDNSTSAKLKSNATVHQTNVIINEN